MSKIRLVQVTHDLAIGGLQRVVATICKTIDRSRFDVSVLCLRAKGPFAEELENEGIQVELIPQPKAGKVDYLSFLKVARYLRRIRPAVLHTHNTQPLIDGVLGAFLAGGVKRIVHTDHARQFPDKRKYMAAEWLLSHAVHRMVGVSDHTSKNLIEYEKISPKKVVTIPNGIDPKPFDQPVNKDAKRAELGLSRDALVLGCCVRLTRQKGIDLLLEAMPAVLQEHPTVMLLLAGDGPLQPELQRQARNLNIQNHVKFLGPRLDIPELLSIFDLYILPSVWEGLPMVLLEAMAAGCPIVATRVGGVDTLLTGLQADWLLESRTTECVSAKVNEMLRADDKRVSISTNNRERFHDSFTGSVMVQSYENLYLT